MDAFVKFLLDYYIWILAVLGIVIVTIIGFLVDSKQKRKKKELESENVSETDKTIENSQTSNKVNNTPMVDAVNQTFPSSVDSGMTMEQSNNYNLNDNNQIGQQNSSQLLNQNIVPNSDVNVALSEQKPHFESREVNIPVSQQSTNPNLYNQVVAPQPVNAVSINQPVQQPVYNQVAPTNGVYQNTIPTGVSNNQQIMPNRVETVQNVQPVYQNATNNQMQPVYNNNMTNAIPNVQPVNVGIQNPAIQPVNSGINSAPGVQNTTNSEDMWKL